MLTGSSLPGSKPRIPGGEAFPDLTLRAAYRAELEGRAEEAAELYRAFFRKGRESAYARARFASILSLQGKHEAAIKQIARAARLDPRTSEYEVIYARILRVAGRPRAAQRRLAAAARTFEGDIRIEIHLAEAYFRLGQRRKAQVHYRQVLFRSGSRGGRAAAYRHRALWRLANIHLRARNLPKSQFYFVRFVRENPDNLFARFVLGYYLYFRRGDYDRAQKELEQIAVYPVATLRRFRIRPALLYSALGEVYFLAKDHRAPAFLKKAYRYNKKNYLDRVLLLVMEGRDRTAFRYLNAYLQVNRTDFVARVARIRILERMNVPSVLGVEYFRVARLAERIGQHRTGIALCRAALAISEKNPEKLKKLRSVLYQQIARHNEALGRPHMAIHYLRESLAEGDRTGRWGPTQAGSSRKPVGKVGPDKKKDAERAGRMRRHALSLGLARILATDAVRRYDDALLELGHVTQDAPGYGRAYYVRGVVHNRMKAHDRAVADFTRAIKLEGKSPVFYFFRAIANHDRQNFKATERDLKLTLKYRPRFAEAANFLGYIYAERGIKLKESLKLIRRAIDIQPTNGAYQDSLGWVYYQTGKYAQARYHLQLAALLLEESKESDPVVYDHLGDVYNKLGLQARAIEAYRRGLQILEQRAKAGPLGAEDRKLRKSIQSKLKRLMKI